MSFNILPIDKSAPIEGKVYLFDSNVWKYILVSPQNPINVENAYINFFEAIINLSSNPRCKKKPFIYLNGLILSEVYNAFMRSHWDAYRVSENSSITFKEYRLTKDFNAWLIDIKSNFRAYKQYLNIENDLMFRPEEILFDIPSFSDYNDHYYFKIAQAKGLSIVTHDGDFKYPSVEILTKNNNLLNLPK